MGELIRKNLCWIVLLLDIIFHKGMLFLLQRPSVFLLQWENLIFKEFVLSFLLRIIEAIIIGYTLIGCTEPSSNEDYREIRVVSYFILSIILSICLIGILAHFELIKSC